jgi:FAD/FMN-containing dehydrogenase
MTRAGSGEDATRAPYPPVVSGALADLLRDVEAVVGRAHVLQGETTAGFVEDWTGRFIGATPAVVRPADTAEVAEVVRLCAHAGVAVVPQGGNTGLVGGGVPLEGELVLSLRRLTTLDAVDTPAAQVTAGAGVTLGALQEHALRSGLRYPVDLAARDSATVGGMVATNAGGVHVIAHGATRAQLRGIEAVLGDGSVVSRLGGVEKDNTGYDLASLLCGSEGTLGIVTAARLRLVAPPRHTVVALAGVASLDAAVAMATDLRATPGLEAVEVFLDNGLALVCERFGWEPPLRGHRPVYLLVESAGAADPTDALASVFAGCDEVAVATDASRRAELWRYREAHTEAIGSLGPPHKLDVAVPVGQLPSFANEVRARVHALAPDARCWLFGHLLDGNLHVNVTGLAPDDERVDDAVLGLVAEVGGSISAEHGIGRAKRPWLHLARSAEEIAAFRAIKGALDPHGILNPGVLLPPA